MNALKEYSELNKALKNMAVISVLSDDILKPYKAYNDSLAYLAYCGVKITKEVIEEIENISITTPLSFRQACSFYVNKKEKELDKYSQKIMEDMEEEG